MSELHDALLEAYEIWGERSRRYTQPASNYVRSHPKSTVALAFLIGVMCGSILKSDIAKLLTVTLVGGIPGAISLGALMGIHPVTCSLIAVAANFVVAAAAINLLYSIEKEPRIAMIISRIRGHFSGFLDPFMKFAGKRGVFLSIVLFTFGIGLVTVFIVDLIKADMQDAKKAILLGLILAAVFWTTIYQVLVTVVPPTVVSMIIVAIILLMVFYSRIRELITRHLKKHPV
ncbi:MAG: hypothetical protein QMC78_04005 [Methanocellales archaeon]|nr:hypothetical protein [Methanocellales archaeon]